MGADPVTKLFAARYNGLLVVFCIGLAGLVRVLEEAWLLRGPVELFPLLHVWGFYVAIFFVFAGVWSLALGTGWRQTAGAVATGVVVFGILPPVIDVVLRNAPATKTFNYLYFTEFSPLLASASQATGETAVLWLLVAASAGTAFLLRRSAFRALLAAGLTYAAILFISHVPFGLGPVRRLAQTDPALFRWLGQAYWPLLALAAYIVLNARRLRPSLSRIAHPLYLPLITLCFSMLREDDAPAAAVKVATVGALAFLFLLHNDLYDAADDAAAGRTVAGIDPGDGALLWLLAVLVGMAATGLSGAAAGLAGVLIVLWGGYHHPSLRLKRRFCLAYKIEGGSAAAAALFGALPGSGFSLLSLDGRTVGAALLVGGGASLLSIWKDYKDIESDRASGTGTLYVLLDRKGIPPVRTNAVLAAVGTLALLVPSVWLAAAGHPTAAVVCGLLGLAPGASMVFARNRRRAVGLAVAGVDLLLLALAVAIRLSGVGGI